MDEAAARLPEDAESMLVAALRQGDPQAYETLVRNHGGPLLALCRRMLRHEEDAREALQEAFLNAFRGISSFSGQSRVGTWLHRIAVNTCLMRLRSRRRRPEEPIEPLLPRFAADGHHLRWPVGWAEPPETILARKESREAVRAAVDRLPDKYRSVLLLRDIEGFDTQETADALAVSTAVVKVRLHRARQALRTLLEERFGRVPR